MNKIKSFLESQTGKNILVALIVVLVGIGAFGLGKTFKKADESSGLGIYSPDQAAGAILAPLPESTDNSKQKISSAVITSPVKITKGSMNPAGMSFMASKIGHKYYPIDCSAGKGIKAENKIYFADEAEANAAGYTRSASCK
ncbi:MAG TPA: hypothetical protein VG694_00060 [Candidatus Paceibacterota bacterium]|jgi:hypothetical protein|nr:hypothetical protein [Candidatus Paceibacterota bacterium]